MASDLPSGTVTFLFTDIEGSTRLLHELGAEGYTQALAEHRRLLRETFADHGGVEVDTQGDAFFVAFPSAQEALDAAGRGQEALAPGPLRVRMGLHTGTPHLAGEGYVGEDVHLGARVASAAHGGQIVLSQATRDAASVDVLDLGEHRLKDFAQPVWLYQLGSERFPPLKTISNTNLPRPASSFVGREREVAEVTALLRNGARLVTLSGPGGSGKTRLSIEAAAELVPDFRNGVFWVGLATTHDPELVLPTIGQTLGAANGLAEHVGERELLLLLDNFEQLVEAAPQLTELVSACPNLRLLVTSRELLRIQGEVEYELLPLGDPEAVELFSRRAGLEATAAVEELCRRLDNMPLALELAAARTKALSPEQILERLSQRLDLFRGGRDAEPRQATLRAAIEWSYDLLVEQEQRLFARLAVFTGGCTLETAEEVAAADLDTLQSLVEKSLVRHTGDRFWMLEAIREFAVERLEESGEAEQLRRRHAEHVRALAQSANLYNEAQGEQRHELVIAEQDNVRAALEWAREADPQLGLWIAVLLENYWATNSPLEGRRHLTELLERASGLPPLLEGLVFRAIGSSWYIRGDFEEGVRWYRRAVDEFQRIGDEPRVGIMLFRLAVDANRLGEREEARALIQESLARTRGHKRVEAQALSLLGNLTFDEGRYDEAFELLERSVELSRETGFRWWEAVVCAAMAEYSLRLGRAEAASEPARRALAIASTIGERQGVVEALALLAWHAAETGREERAGCLWGALEAEEERAGEVGQWEAEREDYVARVVTPTPDFEQGRVEGGRLSLDEAVEYALADA